MKNRTFIWLLLGGGAFVLLAVTLVAILVTLSVGDRGEFAFSDRIQVVDLGGELVESRSILDQLKRYEDSNSVKAILLNIDSPGGGVAVSQEIYAEIKRLRERKDKISSLIFLRRGPRGLITLLARLTKLSPTPELLWGASVSLQNGSTTRI